MPGDHKLRLHIEYDVFYVADLRRIVRTFESAYNILQKAEEPTGRMRRVDRLTVETVRTGNSVTLILLGGMGLAALGRLFVIRENFWKSEKTKWEAKGAKLEYQKTERLMERLNQAIEEARIPQVEQRLEEKSTLEIKAANLVEKLFNFIDKSKEIRSMDVEIDGPDTDPHKPTSFIGPVAPGKPLGSQTVPKRRMFR